jgi:hypothetical protein
MPVECLLRLTSCWILDFSIDDGTGMVGPMHSSGGGSAAAPTSGDGDVFVLARVCGMCLLAAPGAFSNPFFKSLFSVNLLTGVAALLAQGTCPPLSDPIFDSASLMS